jgi:hypothetical protein
MGALEISSHKNITNSRNRLKIPLEEQSHRIVQLP